MMISTRYITSDSLLLSDRLQTLVSVYREILEFYKVAHEILTRRGVKLVMKMILEANRLPEIVTQIVSNADNLERLVSRATWEITQDIQSMLYDSQSEFITTHECSCALTFVSSCPVARQ